MPVNEEMIKIVVKRIERDKNQWYQGTWGSLYFVDEEYWDEPGDPDSKEIAYNRLIVQEQKNWDFVEGKGDLVYLPENPSCKTTFCFAGHAIMEAGYKPVVEFGTDGFTRCEHPETGEIVEVHAAAREVLGLDDAQATLLFEGGQHSLPVFKEIITKVTGVEVD